MEPMQYNLREMRWLSFCPPEEGASLKKRIAYICLFLVVLSSLTIAFLGSIAFMLKYMLIDIKLAFYVLFQIACFSITVYITVVGFLLKHKTIKIYNGLAELYKTYESSESFHFMVEANELGEKLSKIYRFCAVYSFGLNIASLSTLTTILCFKKYHEFDVTVVFNSLKLNLPWNQATFEGYLADISWVIVASVSCLLSSGSFLTLFITMCLHHRAFYQMFEHSVKKIEQHDNISELLRELLQFHISIKKWFLLTTEVFSPLILTQFVCYTVYLASVTYQLDMQIKHLDLKLFLMVVGFSSYVLTIFVYCFCGKMATESFLNMSDCLFESDWIRLPIKFQKTIFFMIYNAQEPIYYRGFGMSTLNMQTFVKIIRSVFSYFMILKAIEKRN